MKNKIVVFSICLNVALLALVACSPMRSIIATNPSTKLHAFVGALPGFRGLTTTNQTAARGADLSLIPKLNAQTATPTPTPAPISMSGSFSGFCSVLNDTGAIATGAAVVLFDGLQDSVACGGNNTNIFPNVSAAASGAPTGGLAIGAGTLGPLVAWAQSSTWTVHVFVNRAGTVIDTDISATLNGTRGQSAATFAVQDGDLVDVMAISDGTVSKNLQFALAKQ